MEASAMHDHRKPRDDPSNAWTSDGVRELRSYLGLSQEGMARRLGTRQQTISEWETGARAPRRMSRQLLRLVAEESGFYRVASDAPSDASGGADSDGPA
jgi:DNA-binding transcriptional regulator YiaG